MEVVDTYTSRSTPLVHKAQKTHAEELMRLKFPWWKKLWEGDEQVDFTQIDKNLEELNF